MHCVIAQMFLDCIENSDFVDASRTIAGNFGQLDRKLCIHVRFMRRPPSDECVVQVIKLLYVLLDW